MPASADMPALFSDLDALLIELEEHLVVPERYSRRSLYGRYEPMLLTAMLAVVAVIGGMVLCELADSRPRPPVGVGSRR